MEEKFYNDGYPEKEIDVYGLWLTLMKRRFLILTLILISTGIATLYALLTPKVYKVTNILLLTQMQDGDLINQSEITAAVLVLDKLKNRQKENVLRLLGIDEKNFKDIRSIKASEIKGSSALWVEIDACDRQTGVALMESLPNYIISNPNIYSKIKLQRSLLQKNRDDLKAIIDNPMSSLKISREAVIYMPSIDLYSLREKYNRLNVLLEKIEGEQFVTLAWKTTLPASPYKPRITIIILTGLAIGIFLGVFSIFFAEWRKNARNAHQMVNE
jgi:LPS O-antigen subunit length determinant protein (WzzB/FepE family)